MNQEIKTVRDILEEIKKEMTFIAIQDWDGCKGIYPCAIIKEEGSLRTIMFKNKSGDFEKLSLNKALWVPAFDGVTGTTLIYKLEHCQCCGEIPSDQEFVMCELCTRRLCSLCADDDNYCVDCNGTEV